MMGCMKFEILNVYELIDFLSSRNSITFLVLVNFLTFLSSRALPSYKPLSYKKTFFVNVRILSISALVNTSI